VTVAGARWDEARMLCPAGEYTSDEWREHYVDHPDVLMQMLGDIFRVYKAEERKKAGLGNPQGGRRKSQIDGSLDELFAIIMPKLSDQPFAQAYAALFPGRSLRAVCMKAGMPHQDLSRKLKGDQPVTRYDLERLAAAADVHPAYFVEWRTMVITELVSLVLARNPRLSLTVLKALSR
jgi:hypothetical protein